MKNNLIVIIASIFLMLILTTPCGATFIQVTTYSEINGEAHYQAGYDTLIGGATVTVGWSENSDGPATVTSTLIESPDGIHTYTDEGDPYGATAGGNGVPIINWYHTLTMDLPAGYEVATGWENSLDRWMAVYADHSMWINLPLERINSAPVPEPTTMILLGIGILGLAGVNRKKMKK